MKLDTVIDDIVESYQKHNDISKVDTIRQPDKQLSLIFLNVYKILFFQASLEEKVLKVIMLNII